MVSIITLNLLKEDSLKSTLCIHLMLMEITNFGFMFW